MSFFSPTWGNDTCPFSIITLIGVFDIRLADVKKSMGGGVLEASSVLHRDSCVGRKTAQAKHGVINTISNFHSMLYLIKIGFGLSRSTI